ncbi:23S rRNA (pseudouridine(1915)-N(3))-methyltransferase RlmH, partial [Sinorhizobium medicae]
MRIGLFAVGRLKAGPEKDLAVRYLDRFAKTGPAVGLE